MGQSQSQALGSLGSLFGGRSADLTTGAANATAAGLVSAANAKKQRRQNIMNMGMQGLGMLFGGPAGAMAVNQFSPFKPKQLPQGSFDLQNQGLYFA
jgi:hypothetical protein